jgi:hypothetical protein
MSILAAIRREQKTVKKNLAKLQHRLSGLETAAQALGNSTNREIKGIKKYVMSAAARAKMARAAKKRWAKIRKQAKRAVS